LRPNFKAAIDYGDGITAPHISVEMRCELHLGNLEGPVVAVGIGGANSWEKKHRYRQSERQCPTCGTVGSVLKSKKEGEGYFCWSKRNGCGATFRPGDRSIEDQV